MFIGHDGLVDLTDFLLSPGQSVDIIARSTNYFFGEALENIIALADSGLRLRCILNFTLNKSEHQSLIKTMEESGWHFRVLDKIASASTIIADGKHFMVSVSASPKNIIHYSDDFEYCKKVSTTLRLSLGKNLLKISLKICLQVQYHLFNIK